MEQTVVGVFDDRSDAEAAMAELIKEGFIKEKIDLAGSKADATAGSTGDSGVGERISNFFGSIFGGDESTARNYTQAAGGADAILTVHADSPQRAEMARDILDRNGAIDVDERSSGMAASGGGKDTGTRGQANARIPVIEENLDVGKRDVERVGARIRSRIIERPVEEHVRLREEHVSVNRRPVDREVTDEDRRRFQPGEMEITEHAEVPIVGKTARVVEEVEVGKQVTERDETIRDTVRGTRVDVDEIDSSQKRTDAKAKRAKP